MQQYAILFMFVIGNKNSDIHDYIVASVFFIIYFFSTYFIQNNIILAEKTYKSVCENSQDMTK